MEEKELSRADRLLLICGSVFVCSGLAIAMASKIKEGENPIDEVLQAFKEASQATGEGNAEALTGQPADSAEDRPI